jgi:DNA-binding NarL/FixJ family response regulator
LPELFGDHEWPRLGEALGLTPRQLLVARSMCRGLKREAIARQLGISENTVRTHVRGLFSRVGVSNRLALVVRLVLTDRALRQLAAQSPSGSSGP